MTLAPIQLPFDRHSHKIRAGLGVLQYRVNPLECSVLEPGLHIFRPKFFASHVVISHMRY